MVDNVLARDYFIKTIDPRNPHGEHIELKLPGA